MNKCNVLLCVIVFLLYASRAEACRCKPQPLETYFSNADFVFIAKIENVKEISEQSVNSKQLRYSLVTDSFKGDLASTERLVTPSSSATCGLQVSPGDEFLIFAVKDTEKSGAIMTHTCTGSRPFSVGSPKPEMGFTDYPAEQVLKALHVLKTAEHFRRRGIGGVPKPDSLIGLLEVRSENNEQPHLFMRSAPDDSAKAIIVDTIQKFYTKEVSYEKPAAVVFERNGSWSRVQTREGEQGWVKDSPQIYFHPIDTLLVNRLSYLTKHWNALMWPSPGAGNPYSLSRSKDSELPVVVEQTEKVANSLWIKVKVFKENPCEGGSATEFTNVGWVPAWNSAGKLTVWYWSRGC